MAFDIKDFQNKLWKTADDLRANSSLKYNEFSIISISSRVNSFKYFANFSMFIEFV